MYICISTFIKTSQRTYSTTDGIEHNRNIIITSSIIVYINISLTFISHTSATSLFPMISFIFSILH